MKIRPKIIDFRSFCVELWPKQVWHRISVPISYISLWGYLIEFGLRAKPSNIYREFVILAAPRDNNDNDRDFFYNFKQVIYDIGTEILYETCFGHNSTQNERNSTIFGRIFIEFYADCESGIKTRFKALFEN